MLKKSDVDLPHSQQTQQEAIYAGLMHIFSEAEATIALKKLNSYISETGSVFNGLNNFARDICIDFDKKDQQRDLIRVLNRALIIKDKPITGQLATHGHKKPASKTILNQPVAQLIMDDFINLAEPVAYVNQPISTPDFETFKILFTNIINEVETNKPSISITLKHFLNELTQSMPWSDAQQEQLQTLIDTGSTNQVRSYGADQLKTYLAHVRTWMDDEIGTTDAMLIFNQALKDTEKMPVSSKYSPKNLM
ncbi:MULTISPECIES: hypothetical protein [Methylotenera]|uniref:hypothetical protein n=1 Tax=Methylotenera TaxID=359407 RepID=UPI000363B191|nr:MULTISPECIES: hypothetical protein [Methylotenera]